MSEIVGKIWRRLPFYRSGQLPDVVQEQAEGDKPIAADDARDQRFNNLEVSDLQFVERVLEESHNPHHPLLERLRFLAISCDVLDQFYSVRVAKMKRSAARMDGYLTPDGLTPATQLARVLSRAKKLMTEQQQTWSSIRRQLEDVDILLVGTKDFTGADDNWAREFFARDVLPVLTPCTIDEEHPFPFIPSGGICVVLAFVEHFILVPLPANLPRFVPLPGQKSRFVLLEDLVGTYWGQLLPPGELVGHGAFQLLRDNDLARQERSDDLRAMVESGLRLRHKANPILLKIDEQIPEEAISFLLEHLSVTDNRGHENYVERLPLPGLSALFGFITQDVANRYSQLLFPPHTPKQPEDWADCFERIAEDDALFHWPYDGFDSVTGFLRQAAEDSNVLSIKQTLYRTSEDSPVVDALIDASRDGKAVTCVIELEAREDESANVHLAKRLEQAGVQISYGIIGLKIHCKATLVARREDEGVVLYTHLSTGNYHAGNAKRYTDISFFSRDPVIGRDANQVFNYITSGHLIPAQKLIVAPRYLRAWLVDQIDRQIALANQGEAAWIVIKVNSFTDPAMAEKLYEASEAGVDIDLVIRRHCILRPGVPGLSSRIRVKSLVGRFLEHSRVYLFSNGKPLADEQAVVYAGSADLMPRNLDERVEILFPVENAHLRRRIIEEIIHANIRDTRQSWVLSPDNEYLRHPEAEGFCAQTLFIRREAASLGQLTERIDTSFLKAKT